MSFGSLPHPVQNVGHETFISPRGSFLNRLTFSADELESATLSRRTRQSLLHHLPHRQHPRYQGAWLIPPISPPTPPPPARARRAGGAAPRSSTLESIRLLCTVGPSCPSQLSVVLLFPCLVAICTVYSLPTLVVLTTPRGRGGSRASGVDDPGPLCGARERFCLPGHPASLRGFVFSQKRPGRRASAIVRQPPRHAALHRAPPAESI